MHAKLPTHHLPPTNPLRAFLVAGTSSSTTHACRWGRPTNGLDSMGHVDFPDALAPHPDGEDGRFLF